jgi:hypothetical protein
VSVLIRTYINNTIAAAAKLNGKVFILKIITNFPVYYYGNYRKNTVEEKRMFTFLEVNREHEKSSVIALFCLCVYYIFVLPPVEKSTLFIQPCEKRFKPKLTL